VFDDETAHHGDPGHGNHHLVTHAQVQVARSAASSALPALHGLGPPRRRSARAALLGRPATPGCFGASGVAEIQDFGVQGRHQPIGDVSRGDWRVHPRVKDLGWGRQSRRSSGTALQGAAHAAPFRTRFREKGLSQFHGAPGKLPVYSFMPSIRRKDTDGRGLRRAAGHEV